MEGREEVGVEPGLWGASGLVVVDGEEAHGHPWSPIGRQEEKYSAMCCDLTFRMSEISIKLFHDSTSTLV